MTAVAPRDAALASLAGSDGVALLVADRDGRVESVSPGLAAWVAAADVTVSPGDRLQDLTTLVAPEGTVAEAFRTALGSGTHARATEYVPGVSAWVDVVVHVGPACVVALFRDVTTTQREVQASRLRREAVADWPDGGDLSDLVHRTAHTLRVALGWPAAEVWGWQDDRPLRWAVDVDQPTPSLEDYLDTDRVDAATHQLLTTVRDGAVPIQVRTDRDGTARADRAVAAGLVSSLHVPFHPRGHEGVVVTLHGRVDPSRHDWLEVLRVLRPVLQDALRAHAVPGPDGQLHASLGALAGGIAHDLNNVLAPIVMAMDLLRLDDLDDVQAELVETVSASARRGTELVGQVLDLARGDDGHRRAVDPNAVIGDLAGLAREVLGRDIHLVTDLGSDRQVSWDPTRLHQVLLNLAVNARDAMPDGGTLRIATASVMVDETFVAMTPELSPGPYVQITVSDTGHGIDPKLLDRVFDPFFSTREQPAGTGLGLSTALALVRDHGGHLGVDSDPGRGTSVRLLLPAIATPSGAGAGETDPPRGTATVLVVDDEASIRDVVKRALAHHGYEVLTARDGAEAVSTFVDHDDVDLLVTDLAMPIMDGVETVRALRHLSPDLPVVAASGIVDRARAIELDELGVDTVLAKPFTTAQLLEAVHRGLRDGTT